MRASPIRPRRTSPRSGKPRRQEGDTSGAPGGVGATRPANGPRGPAPGASAAAAGGRLRGKGCVGDKRVPAEKGRGRCGG